MFNIKNTKIIHNNRKYIFLFISNSNNIMEKIGIKNPIFNPGEASPLIQANGILFTKD